MRSDPDGSPVEIAESTSPSARSRGSWTGRAGAAAARPPIWRSRRSSARRPDALCRSWRSTAAAASSSPTPWTRLDAVPDYRLEGGPTTDFGAPERWTASDDRPTDLVAADRLARLVEAASVGPRRRRRRRHPPSLRKGPRGGGRDRDKVVEHVLQAEHAYARNIGLKLPAAGRRRPGLGRARPRGDRRRPARAVGRLADSTVASGTAGTPPAASRGTSSTTPGRSRTGPTPRVRARTQSPGPPPRSRRPPSARRHEARGCPSNRRPSTTSSRPGDG